MRAARTSVKRLDNEDLLPASAGIPQGEFEAGETARPVVVELVERGTPPAARHGGRKVSKPSSKRSSSRSPHHCVSIAHLHGGQVMRSRLAPQSTTVIVSCHSTLSSNSRRSVSAASRAKSSRRGRLPRALAAGVGPWGCGQNVVAHSSSRSSASPLYMRCAAVVTSGVAGPFCVGVSGDEGGFRRVAGVHVADGRGWGSGSGGSLGRPCRVQNPWTASSPSRDTERSDGGLPLNPATR